MSDAPVARKRGPFRVFFYRGIEVKKLMDLSQREFVAMLHSRARRRFARGRVSSKLIKRIRKAKKQAEDGQKPPVVKTHQRNMIILPEMVGSIVGVYNGKDFTQVEIKPQMIGHYLGEFSITYKPVGHGRGGLGGKGGKLMPL